MTALQEVQKLIPQLSASDVSQVRNLLALFNNQKEEKVDNWLIDGFIRELELRGLPRIPKISTTQTYKSKKLNIDKICNYFEQFCNTTNQKRLLGNILARCLITYIESWSEISLLKLIHHVDLTIEAFERMFPGYLQSKLLVFLLTARRE